MSRERSVAAVGSPKRAAQSWSMTSGSVSLGAKCIVVFFLPLSGGANTVIIGEYIAYRAACS